MQLIKLNSNYHIWLMHVTPFYMCHKSKFQKQILVRPYYYENSENESEN